MNESTPITIQVTQSDIERGLPGNCFGCPIALAAWRVVRAGVTVTTRSINLPVGFRILPEEAKQFIRDFDEGREVKPFTFTL